MLTGYTVVPYELPITANDTEIKLDNYNLVNFEVKNLGAANLILFNQTVLQTEDCWQPPTNQLGIPFSGRIALSWGSGNKSAVLYGLRLVPNDSK